MSELTAPRIETAPEKSSRFARMLGKAASWLDGAAERAEARSTQRSTELPQPGDQATAHDPEVAVNLLEDLPDRSAGYDFRSAEATAALDSIVARKDRFDERGRYGLQREENSRAARKDRKKPAYAATEKSLLETDEVSVDDTDQPSLLDIADRGAGYDLKSKEATEALDSIVARQKATEERREKGLSGEQNDRAARKQRRKAAQQKREAAYAARESAQLGIDIEPGADSSDVQRTSKVRVSSDSQPTKAEVAVEEYKPRHAKKSSLAESETTGGQNFDWLAQAEAAGFTRAPKPEATDSQAEQSSRPSLAEVFRHPSVLGMFMGAEVQAKLVEAVRKRRIPNENRERREVSDRTKFVVAAGTIGVALAVGIARAYYGSRGNDTSALDAGTFDLQPIMPIDGGSEAVEQLSQTAPIDTTPASELASQTAETASASGGGGSRASGAGGTSETVGALSGEAIDSGAWDIPKNSGGEQLMERIGADKSVWYEHQNAFLKRFPNEAYRMTDGNVGLKLQNGGRLSQGAIDFWTKAVSK